jgi:hypothetical protein
LIAYFRDPPEFNIDFMVAAMQFVNIIVHSVDDMNYRIYLQYEFQLLGLNDLLEVIIANLIIFVLTCQTYRLTESEILQSQVLAYLDNAYDVTQLYEDSEHKIEAETHCRQAEAQCSKV